MNGPFITPGDTVNNDGAWQNALGTFPSIKARFSHSLVSYVILTQNADWTKHVLLGNA